MSVLPYCSEFLGSLFGNHCSGKARYCSGVAGLSYPFYYCVFLHVKFTLAKATLK